ncbi:MAG: S8 family serine peptidase, partial [Myxococcaceae bacterium]
SSSQCIAQGIAPTPSAVVKAFKNGDSDRNGKADDLIGWDFAQNDNDPSIRREDTKDDVTMNHGVEMAGMIGAVTNNSTDVVGTAWRVRLALIRTSSEAESRNAFRYAAEKLRVHVINYSRGQLFLTGEAPDIPNFPDLKCPVSGQKLKQDLINSKFSSYQDDFKQMDLSNTLLVAAVSNCPIDVDEPGVLELPAEADSNSILAVTTGSSTKAYGATTVDVAGLGGPVRSLKHRAIDGKTSQTATSGDSTSFATAYASGVAALVLSQYPDLRGRPDCLREFLTRNGRGTTAKPIRGTGTLHMFDAVTNAVKSPVPDGCPR